MINTVRLSWHPWKEERNQTLNCNINCRCIKNWEKENMDVFMWQEKARGTRETWVEPLEWRGGFASEKEGHSKPKVHSGKWSRCLLLEWVRSSRSGKGQAPTSSIGIRASSLQVDNSETAWLRASVWHKHAEWTAEDHGHLGGTYSGSLRSENSGARGEGKGRVAELIPLSYQFNSGDIQICDLWIQNFLDKMNPSFQNYVNGQVVCKDILHISLCLNLLVMILYILKTS